MLSHDSTLTIFEVLLMVQLTNLATPDDVEEEKATLGGFTALSSGLYKMKIKLAFLHPSKGGALGLHMHFDNNTGDVLRETLWIVSGNAKGNNSFYVRDGKKRLLPGMEIAKAISQLTLGKDLSELESEEKTVDVYNSDSQSEMPTKVQMIEELMGKEVVLGVKHNIVDKNVKNSSGVYVPSGETREENVIDRVFSADTGMIVQEVQSNASEPIFIHKWKEKWEGKTTDKSTKNVAAHRVPGKTASGAPAPAAPALFPADS